MGRLQLSPKYHRVTNFLMMILQHLEVLRTLKNFLHQMYYLNHKRDKHKAEAMNQLQTHKRVRLRMLAQVEHLLKQQKKILLKIPQKMTHKISRFVREILLVQSLFELKMIQHK